MATAACLGALALAALMLPQAARAGTEVLAFRELAGWLEDDHAAALAVFRETCDLVADPAWQPVCAFAHDLDVTDARAFFEVLFRPVVLGSPPALFTGYYEPELRGSRVRTGRFVHPIYRLPPELPEDQPWLSRSEIEEAGVLAGRGLEIAWLEDPVEVYFLQIQGSGRIRLTDGRVIRVGFAGKNNQPFRSVGEELVRRGVFAPHQVSAPVIRAWVRRNPEEGAALLRHNPSYVFFREVQGLAADRGPIGAMARPIVALRSIAVDPAHVPLGAPVWVEKAGAAPLARLMVAQDAGGAIRGAQRADIFYGSGPAAGAAAGMVRDPGRLVTLLPIDVADALNTGF
jgi:membrane-bound lytic murein transglycosylase A